MIGLHTLFSRRGEPSRRARRIVVITALAAIPLSVFALSTIARAAWPHPLGLIAFVVPLVLVGVPLLALQEFRRNIIRRGAADERERQRRDEAYRISYRILEFGPLLCLLAVAWFREELAAILAVDWFLIFWPLYGYILFLPYAVFAWREPDVVD